MVKGAKPRGRGRPNKRLLSEFVVRNLKPGAAAYFCWDTKQAGLAVRVETTGHKSWKCIYKLHGRRRDYHIERVNAIGLAAARDIAKDVLTAVAKGLDPAAEKRAKRTAGTFKELHELYLERHAKKENKSWRQGDYLARTYLFPRWQNLQAVSITRDDVEALVASIKRPVLHNQVLAAASAVFSWAMKQRVGGIVVNPCSNVRRNKTRSRERVLSEEEVRLFWPAFDRLGVPGAALKMILLTGQRPGEVARMRREHLVRRSDGLWWELPGEIINKLGWAGTKNKQSHRVAISRDAERIIDAMNAEGFVFAGPTSHVREAVLAKIMRDLCAKFECERATPHDLRRTCGTAITGLGHGRDAMDRIQNHKKRGSVTDVYDRYGYATEDRHIMQTVTAEIARQVRGAAKPGAARRRQPAAPKPR